MGGVLLGMALGWGMGTGFLRLQRVTLYVLLGIPSGWAPRVPYPVKGFGLTASTALIVTSSAPPCIHLLFLPSFSTSSRFPSNSSPPWAVHAFFSVFSLSQLFFSCSIYSSESPCFPCNPPLSSLITIVFSVFIFPSTAE